MAPFLVWALLRLTGWEPGFRWRQLVAFTPYVALTSLIVPTVALFMRRWTAAMVAVAVALTLGIMVIPRGQAGGNPTVHGPALRVLSANLMFGQASPEALMALVRRTTPDILTLQEFTPRAEAALDQSGLNKLLPHKVSHPRPGAGGSAIYARSPLRESQPLIDIGFAQPRATVEIPGALPVEVVSVHPCAPTKPAAAACWAAGLRALPPADRKGPLRILAGDFNVTLDHAYLHRLLRTGYRDAADSTGNGLRPTWPSNTWRPGRPPPITLDHILFDPRAAIRKYSIHNLPGTDHRAVYSELHLPTR